jgi:hypothetical protein
MSEKHLHIISFDVPWPADYGGVIDVFYQIKALHRAGVKVHLHCFQYGRDEAPELEEYCESVHYYPRKTGWLANLSKTPYIIKSRRSNALVRNLLRDDYPIVCQGMHSCAILTDKRLAGRKIAYRAANVEQFYYQALYRRETNRKKMYYFMAEAVRLKKWEPKLARADVIFTISEADEAYYRKRFPNQKVVNLFGFFDDAGFAMQEGRGDYILYQGNLSVNENQQAVDYILTELLPELPAPLIIAGKNPPQDLKERISKLKNVDLVPNPSNEEMQKLIREAHINLLLTFQPTGLKLKLLNALYQGRFCVANKEMLYGAGLDEVVETANEAAEILAKIKHLKEQDFSTEEIERRKSVLLARYDTQKRIALMLEHLF